MAASLGEDRFSAHPEGAKGFWRELVTRVAARLDLPPPSPFLAAELFERFAHGDAWETFADVKPCLEALRDAGLRLAVVSNFDARLPRVLADTGLAGLFDCVVYSEEVGVEKPHPAIFEELLERLQLPAARVLHVGDSRRDDGRSGGARLPEDAVLGLAHPRLDERHVEHSQADEHDRDGDRQGHLNERTKLARGGVHEKNSSNFEVRPSKFT